jgi:hypothetical protein
MHGLRGQIGKNKKQRISLILPHLPKNAVPVFAPVKTFFQKADHAPALILLAD